MINAYKIFVGMPEDKRTIGKPMNRYEDNIKMYFEGLKYEDVNWIRLAQDTNRSHVLVNTDMKLGNPQKRGWVLTN
jgi:hypothetical protein